jgi:hypothetical protein
LPSIRRSTGFLRCGLDLKALPLLLGKRFIIGDFSDQIGRVGTKATSQFLLRRGGIFDGVVEQRRDHQIGIGF